ncbi:hypothetical protein ALC56_00252 [Trachymyrmex septentrionalis]|uniref:Uncharacterized protein n=1 Tax=Trachymyrmex septentrionalis TaxID=34720 RepID=A0A151K1I9_9HYME|nr:hypothetical protein ALC56_00252 [Trachymyrmex septentrionalis]
MKYLHEICGFSAARRVDPSNRVPRVYTPAHVLFVCAASQPEASQPTLSSVVQRGKQPPATDLHSTRMMHSLIREKQSRARYRAA